jgi:tetratricopeptide (TPR) repeat protein
MKKPYGTPAWKEWWLPLFIIIAVSLAVYANTLGSIFVYDDDFMVMRNTWIRDVRFLPKIFLSNSWGSVGGPNSYYRPMVHVMFMLTYYIFGLTPWGFHLVNIVLHAGSSVLVFLIAKVLFSEYKSPSKYLSIPLMAAVLFAVHPIHTEAVAWVSGIPDLSYSFFCLLSLYLYIRSENRFNTAYYLSVAAFSIGTLCKEPALLLPALLLAYDMLLNKNKPGFKLLLKRYALFALVICAYMGMRFYVLGGGMAPAQHGEYVFYGNIFVIFAKYLKKLVLPVHLKLIYLFRPVHSLLEAKALISVLFTALVAAIFYLAYKKDRLIFFCLLIIAVPLLPCLYTPAITGSSVVGERYLYLPSAGFAMLVSFMIARLAYLGRGRIAAASVFLALVALYSAGTVLRNRDWKDDYRLWTAEMKYSPGSDVAHDNLCLAAGAHINLGVEYEKRGRDDLAIDEYITATKCNPMSDDAYVAYKDIGNAYARIGKVDESIQAYEESLKVKTSGAEAHNNADIHNNLGVEYARKGDMKKAVEHFQAAVRLDPNDQAAEVNLEKAVQQMQNK